MILGYLILYFFLYHFWFSTHNLFYLYSICLSIHNKCLSNIIPPPWKKKKLEFFFSPILQKIIDIIYACRRGFRSYLEPISRKQCGSRPKKSLLEHIFYSFKIVLIRRIFEVNLNLILCQRSKSEVKVIAYF